MSYKEIEDQDLWPDNRLELLKAEVAAEEKRRAQVRSEAERQRIAADADLQAQANEAERKRLGKLSQEEYRREMVAKYGFSGGV
jgi:hypothetical protein